MGVECVTGDVRLANFTDDPERATREGRLEVCINSAWGAVCDDLHLGPPEAAVACRQMNFSEEGE